MTRSIDVQKPAIGSIGVMLNDTRHNPRMFKLHLFGDMGRAYFEPLDDPGALVVNPLVEFWPLIDALP